MHKAGCRFGDKCRYLHPKLCQNSVTMKMCLNEDCKLTHLKYTKRHKPNDRLQSDNFKRPVAERHNTNSYSGNYRRNSHMENPKVYNRDDQREDTAAKYTNDAVSESVQKNQYFLGNAMEKMQRELSEQIQYQIQRQMDLHFRKLQEDRKYDREFPSNSMPKPMNPNWDQEERERQTSRGRW